MSVLGTDTGTAPSELSHSFCAVPAVRSFLPRMLSVLVMSDMQANR